MREGLQAVLFDATGTLLDPLEPVGETYSRFARDFGVEIDPRCIADAFRRILRGARPRVFEDAAVDEIPALERRWWRELVRGTIRAADSSVQFDDFEGFFAALFEHFEKPDAWVLRAGARQALAALHGDGYPLGLVSNFDYRLLDILEGLALTEFFSSIKIPASCGMAKPGSAIFAAALEQLGATADRALYVGHDPELDLAAAARAGLRTLDVAELRDLTELPARLEALATLE
jgi:putative hydrolase of the HAD superfamily